MLFIVSAMDKPNSLELRMANRPAHFDYAHATGRIRLGGPYLDHSGAMIGSMMIVEADSLEEVRAWAAADPYAKAGLFASTTILPWKATANFCEAKL